MERIAMILLIGFFGVLALFVASNAQHGLPYWAALAFFVFSILLNFKLIAVHDEHAH